MNWMHDHYQFSLFTDFRKCELSILCVFCVCGELVPYPKSFVLIASSLASIIPSLFISMTLNTYSSSIQPLGS
jgi:hypothetical protein